MIPISSIFQPEVIALESQVAALQAQIAIAQQRITALGECEVEADGMLQVVQKTLGKISALAPDAKRSASRSGGIATLKASVLNLFNDSGVGDDNQGDAEQSGAFVLKQELQHNPKT